MNPSVQRVISSLRFGETQASGKFSVIPILDGEPEGPEYLVLPEALREDLITITEVSAGGSVPDLRVINRADRPVLLLDGEELAGAKQNRVVNTTILVKEKCETIIPVSCTEQGRWAHISPHFAESESVMAHKARAKKTASVSESYRRECRPRSDQREVWKEVLVFQECAQVASPTGAMRDVFVEKREVLEDFLKPFECVETQCGFIAVQNGRVMGMDRISRPDGYRFLHTKLLKSYGIEAYLDRAEMKEYSAMDVAQAFLQKIPTLTEQEFPSVGYGTDLRYRNGGICGSALVHENTCIHAAFFTSEESRELREPMEYISPLNRRREYRL